MQKEKVGLKKKKKLHKVIDKIKVVLKQSRAKWSDVDVFSKMTVILLIKNKSEKIWVICFIFVLFLFHSRAISSILYLELEGISKINGWKCLFWCMCVSLARARLSFNFQQASWPSISEIRIDAKVAVCLIPNFALCIVGLFASSFYVIENLEQSLMTQRQRQKNY